MDFLARTQDKGGRDVRPPVRGALCMSRPGSLSRTVNARQSNRQLTKKSTARTMSATNERAISDAGVSIWLSK